MIAVYQKVPAVDLQLNLPCFQRLPEISAFQGRFSRVRSARLVSGECVWPLSVRAGTLSLQNVKKTKRTYRLPQPDDGQGVSEIVNRVFEGRQTPPARLDFFRPGDRVATAVSGGADSVALLALLLDVRADLGIVVSVAHFNHRLRGAESDADAEFVAGLAAKHGLEYFSATADLQHDRNIEALARRDRYAFFASLTAGSRATRVATAHTADDQAETVLTRLLRGSGTAGIAGILPERDNGTIVRPLLNVRRGDLRAWAVARQLTWREDASNLDRRFLRNRVRQDLLPMLARDYNPAIVDVLGRAAEVARGDEAEWQRLTTALADRLVLSDGTDGADGAEGTGWKLCLADFVQLGEGQQRRLLRAAIAKAKQDLRRIDYRHVEKVRIFALKRVAVARGAGGVLELPGLKVEVRGNWIKIGV